jgi:hypothetical protein
MNASYKHRGDTHNKVAFLIVMSVMIGVGFGVAYLVAINV